MSIKHPLKYHLSTFVKPFIAYALIFLVTTFAMTLGFKNYINLYEHLTIIIILLPLLFMSLAAFYEFASLIFHFYNVRLIKTEFLLASFVFNIVMSIINTIMIFIYYLIISQLFNPNITDIFPFNSFSVYLFIFVINFTTFSLVGAISLFLAKIKSIRFIIYSIIVLMIGFITRHVAVLVVDFIFKVFNNSSLLLLLTPAFGAFNLLLWGLIYFKAKTIS